MQPDRVAEEALRLLDGDAAAEQRARLSEVRDILTAQEDPMDRAVRVIETALNKETVNVR